MASRMPDQDLELLLVDIGRRLAYPQPTRMADAVRARLRAGARPVPWWRRYRLAPAMLTALLLVVGIALASPDVRAKAGELLRFGGIDIFRGPANPSLTPRPSPSGTAPGGIVPGEQVSLAEAQRRVSFTIGLPAQLGAPDAVFVDQAGHVTLVYGERPGLPVPATTGVAALVVEFRGSVDAGFFGKSIGPDTTLEQTTVAGAPAYWLAGAPHFFFARDPAGTVVQETLRLAGNTLIWVRNEVTYRLEANVSRDAAVGIATTIR